MNINLQGCWRPFKVAAGCEFEVVDDRSGHT